MFDKLETRVSEESICVDNVQVYDYISYGKVSLWLIKSLSWYMSIRSRKANEEKIRVKTWLKRGLAYRPTYTQIRSQWHWA